MPTDDFNRANAGSLGANWTEQVNGLQVLSNACRGANAGSTYQFAYWSADAFADDQYSEFTVTTVAEQFGPAVRCSGTGGATDNYWLLLRASGEGSSFIFKTDAGSFTSLADLGAVAWTAGDVARIEVSGTTVTAKRNGVTLDSATDSSLASGSAGIMCRGDGAVVDDWAGGDLGGGGGATSMPARRGRAVRFFRGR